MIFDAGGAQRLAVTVREMAEADLPFIAALYASTRRDELAATGWPEPMQRAFLAQQHEAQHGHYRTAFPDAEWLIVERRGAPIGRLYLHWTQDRVRVVDISLLPEARGQGIGGLLLRALQRQARAGGRKIALGVVPGNPARRLYSRLGFVAAAGLDASRDEMVWPG
jgi:GNAT superfamily N-acetyltransferase